MVDAEEKPKLQLACLRCQRRKIKCDRNYPCQHCKKGNLSCIQGNRKRRIGSAHVSRQTELCNRLERLESLLKGAKPDHPQNEPSLAGSTPPQSTTKSPNTPCNRYMASGFWQSIADEVQSMREALESSAPDDPWTDYSTPEHLSQDISQPEDDSLIDFILVNPGRIHPIPGALPDPDVQIQSDVYNVYVERIDRAWKIFHIPTLNAFMQHHQAYLQHTPSEPCCEALRACIYFAGLLQISNEEFLSRYGQPRTRFLRDFQRIAEAALVQSNLLGSRALPALQAFIVYIAALRRSNSGHRSWTLFGLAMRLAQTMNLERELPDECFFMTQMRRRLWHHMVVLDSFFALDRGTEPLISPGVSSRPLPLNINDTDFHEDTRADSVLPRSRQFTDMTFALMQQECFGAAHSSESSGVPSASLEQRLVAMRVRHEEIESTYMVHCNAEIPFERLAIKIGRVMQGVNLLTTARPINKSQAQQLAIDTPWIFELAIDILRQTDELYRDAVLVPWTRLHWVQWHPLAIVLSRLCTIRGTSEADEAWGLVDRAIEFSSRHIADSMTGGLWQPLAKLYRTARSFRDGVTTIPGSLESIIADEPTLDQGEGMLGFNLQAGGVGPEGMTGFEWWNIQLDNPAWSRFMP